MVKTTSEINALLKKQPLNQEEFDTYLRKLPYIEECMFRIGGELYFCRDEKFHCVYRSKETFALRIGEKHECKRQNVLKIKNVLGD